jgi:methylated-DNA-[protein]-cysteine S-methyltransferase
VGERLLIDRLATPLGATLLVTEPGGILLLVHWEDSARDWQGELRRSFGDAELAPAQEPSRAAVALRAYFEGQVRAVEPVEVSFWGSEFQTAVWRALRTIPAGQTSSYGALAQAMGRPRSSRAVGLANGANPIPIVVPCHRVIGSDGSLTGFGGGLWRKRWLLDHEARHAGTGAAQLEMPL